MSGISLSGGVIYYPPEYFSGCDVFVNIGGIKYDISYIQYKVESSAIAMYHYNNPVANKIITGNRLVVGVFSVLIKSDPTFIKRLYGNEGAVMRTKPNYSIFNQESMTTPGNLNLLDTPEKVISASVQSPLWGSTSAFSDSEISLSGYKAVMSSIEGGSEFDISISYGKKSIWHRIYGLQNRIDVIRGCVVIGKSTMVRPDGHPLADIYTFQARDVLLWASPSISQGEEIINGRKNK